MRGRERRALDFGFCMGAAATKHVGAPSVEPSDRCRHAVDRLSEAQLDEFRSAFNRFDTDRSGYIDAGELRLLCEWVGQETNKEELGEMMALGVRARHIGLYFGLIPAPFILPTGPTFARNNMLHSPP